MSEKITLDEDYYETLMKRLHNLREDIVKAKQVIKDLLADNADWTNKLEAEQFLKEIEK